MNRETPAPSVGRMRAAHGNFKGGLNFWGFGYTVSSTT